MKKCSDCYEANEDWRTRCSRCGRLLDMHTDETSGSTKAADRTSAEQGKFEVQHMDAPNVMRSDRSVYRK